MDEKEFIDKMEKLKKPGFENNSPNKLLKLAIVNSKRSAAMGVWFLAVPCYFLLMIFLKYYFNMNLHIIDIFEEFIASLDKSPATKFVIPLFFVFLPVVGIIINLLSVMFFEYDKDRKQINISIMLKPFNIMLALISFAVVSVFMLYLVAENIHP